MPLPKYGTVDPTPFVAVFFPMFFGTRAGGHRLRHNAWGHLAHLALPFGGPAPRSLRSISEIGLACSLFTIVFGFLYTESSSAISGTASGSIRSSSIAKRRFFPFLGLRRLRSGSFTSSSASLVGAVKMFRGDKRRATRKGHGGSDGRSHRAGAHGRVRNAARAFFHALWSSPRSSHFPILIIAEGVLAPIELVSTLGNVLSYARIMAVGTASVMMADRRESNDRCFWRQSWVGVLFALLFHLINFVLGVFSPTIHMLRLHYVEFFGKFYSPGGSQYRPFRHWSARRRRN